MLLDAPPSLEKFEYFFASPLFLSFYKKSHNIRNFLARQVYIIHRIGGIRSNNLFSEKNKRYSFAQ